MKRSITLTSILVVLVFSLSSCTNCISQEDYNAAKSEADDLRAQVASLQSDLDTAQNDLEIVQNDLATAESQILALQEQLEAATLPPTEEEPGEEPTEEEPSEYGTPPWEPSEDYPYLGAVPPGAEGKIRLEYNVAFDIDPSGQYFVSYKITNISDRIIDEYIVRSFQKDAEGTVKECSGISSKGDFNPGETHTGGGNGGWIDPELIPPVTVYAEITYVKFK